MATTRRQFIKRGLGMVTVSVALPQVWLGGARAQAGDPDRRILVVIEMLGGNDGLNTVVPYTDSRYYSFRPTLGIKDTELKDAQGRTTIISDRFGLHPSMGRMKELYDAGRVAIVQGVGYPEPSLSHFLSADIWHTTNPTGKGDGWLGRYAEAALEGEPGLSVVSIGPRPPKTFTSSKVVVPNIFSFDLYSFQTDQKYASNRSRKIDAFNAIYGRSFPDNSFASNLSNIGLDAVTGAARIGAAPANYRSTVVYPANNPLAAGLKMLAQIITAIPETRLLYVQFGFFDHHANQIGGPTSKLTGQHATLLEYFSDGVKAFYDDMIEHELADKVVILQWSEFGRRPNQNNSLGTDHGTASSLFIIGNPVAGGLYGQQPSLDALALDEAGNLKFNVDFRSVYATVIDGWLGGDSEQVLGSRYENVGFIR
jgi:uncharacterized protein (DUF1501 family)